MSIENIAPFDYCWTRSTNLASALIAMGIEPHTQPFQHMERDDGSKFTSWQFKSKSECGKWDTLKLINAWRDGEEWVKENEEHPFAYLVCAFKNREMLMDILNEATPTVTIKRDGKTWRVPKGGLYHQKLTA